MADTGIWGLGAIASPAATDRLPLESSAGAGGYSERGEFIWRDASGNYLCNGKLGIGVTAPAVSHHVKSSGEIARFETTTVRGSGNGYFRIADPTGSKGFIGYGGANDVFYVANQLNAPVTIATNDVPRWNFGSAGAFEPAGDNTYNIGIASTGRIKDLFLVNSPTVTSDASEKEWLGAGFSPALLSAAKRIAAEIGSYKWLAAIAREADGGPAARIHFGVRAQAVWDILADEGLIDPVEEGVAPTCPYAFLCYDEWDAIDPVEAVEEVLDEDGEVLIPAQPARPGVDAGHRFGIRPDQLAMFLIAAQEARLSALEALITEGE